MKNIACLLLMLFISSPLFAADAVVVRVNGVAITNGDVEAEIDRLIPRSIFHGTVSQEKRGGFREKALDNLTVRELQYQDAMARGMKPDKKAVKAQLAGIRDKFNSKKEYETALARAGLTAETLEARTAKEVLVQQVIARTVTEPAVLSDAALKAYYDANPGKFREPESVRLRIISIRDEKKAAEALAQVDAGKDFGAVAATMSEDQYRIMGGDLGYQHRGRLIPEVEDVAFSKGPGETSDLIRGKTQWFIIQVEDKKPERQLSFEESRDKLKSDLESKRAKELLEKWVEELRRKAKIEFVEKAAEEKP